MSRVPRIRFKGFEEDWEQRKLGELMNVISVKRIHQSDWSTEGVRFLRARDIVADYKHEEVEDLLYISQEKYEECSALVGKVAIDDMLVTGVGTIGIPYLIKDLTPLYFKDGNIIWFQNNGKIQGDFFYYSFTAAQIQNFIKDSAGIGTVGTYTIESGKKTPILLPSEAEQNKIGQFFKDLDNLITLHQRKLEKLKIIKKSMLENLFPQNGEKAPKIRFSGFTKDWEQRKLSSIAEEITRTDPESTAPVMMITANNGFIEQSDRYAFNNAGKSLKKYILLEKGEMAYNHGASKLRSYGSCFALTTAESARIPFVYHCFSVGDNDPEFVSMELNGTRVENQLRKIVSSGARMDGLLNISYEEYASVELVMTCIPEQHILADYFRQLNHLITLHQSKFEKLQKIKKSMLESMFV